MCVLCDISNFYRAKDKNYAIIQGEAVSMQQPAKGKKITGTNTLFSTQTYQK